MGRSCGSFFRLAVFGLGIVQMSACSKGHEEWRSNLEEHYHNHHEVLEALVAICEENPWLRRVDAQGDYASHYSDVDRDLQYLSIEEHVRQTLQDIDALAVSCDRRGDLPGKPLAGVGFVYYSVGLSVAGRGGSIVYFCNWSRDSFPFTDEQLEKEGYLPLNKRGWYTFVN